MQGVAQWHRCLTRQPLSHGLASFLGVMDVAVSGEAEVLCGAEESGMSGYTGCARGASTHGRSTCIHRCLNRALGALRLSWHTCELNQQGSRQTWLSY